jgi:HEAT repeat protein
VPTNTADLRTDELGRATSTHPEGIEVGDSEVESLISTLRGGSVGARCNAADALGDLGDPRAVEPLIGVLDYAKALRDAAAAALVKIGDAAVEPVAGVLFAHSTARIRAAEILGDIGDPRGVEPLITALQIGAPPVRRRVAAALGKIGDPRAVEPLSTALEDKDRDVRFESAIALGKLGDGRSVESLLAVLRDGGPETRRRAAEVLEGLGWLPSSAADRVLHAVATERWDRAVAEGEPAVGALIAALRSKSSSVREGAAEALGELGDARAVEPLAAARTDESAGVRASVDSALGRLGWQPPAEVEAPAQQDDLTWTLDDVRRLEDEQNVDALLQVIDPGASDQVGWEVRGAAGHALARIGDARAVPALIKGLDLLRGDEAARALGNFKDPRAVEPLLKALRKPRFGNRHAVAEALGKIGDSRAVPGLIGALNVEVELPVFQRTSSPAIDTTLRCSAIEALGEIRDPDAIDALRDALEDEHDFIVHAAEEALGKIPNPAAEEAAAPYRERRQREWEEQALGLIGLLDEGFGMHVPSLGRFDLVAQEAGAPRDSLDGWRVTDDGLLYVDGMAAAGPRACQEHSSPMDDLNAVSRGRYMSFEPEALVVLYGLLLGQDFANHLRDVARTNELLPYAAAVLGGCAGSFAHALRHSGRVSRQPVPRFNEVLLEGDGFEAWQAELRACMDDAAFEQSRILYGVVLSSWSEGVAAP